MNFKIKISKEVDSDWNECLSKSKYSTAFQTSNWINNYKKIQILNLYLFK